MSQVITNAFEQYWQSCLAAEKPVVLDEFILADIPNLDITSPIDPETGLPPESQIVHRQNVDQRGRINNNAVAYTIVMDTTVGDFSFNAMYLRNKANGVIGMIVYKGRETKLKTDQTTGQTGNSLVKSMLMGYDQAAEATLTHVDAGTWQIDYAARLHGQDEDLRQLASQLYGHHTFIGDGFKVVQQAGSHQVTPGVAIVGGLRVELKQPEVIYPGSKPIGVWVDVHRAGSLLSEHQNHFTIITSVADLTDHVDSNGYPHFVAKLGIVQADNSVVDGRGITRGETSIPESLSLLEQADAMLAITSWEALRRSYAEAGYLLEPGSFEYGLVLTAANSVGLHLKTGKAYSSAGSFPQTMDAGINPASGGFTDRSGEVFRGQVKGPEGAKQVGFNGSNVYNELARLSNRTIIDAREFGLTTEGINSTSLLLTAIAQCNTEGAALGIGGMLDFGDAEVEVTDLSDIFGAGGFKNLRFVINQAGDIFKQIGGLKVATQAIGGNHGFVLKRGRFIDFLNIRADGVESVIKGETGPSSVFHGIGLITVDNMTAVNVGRMVDLRQGADDPYAYNDFKFVNSRGWFTRYGGFYAEQLDGLIYADNLTHAGRNVATHTNHLYVKDGEWINIGGANTYFEGGREGILLENVGTVDIGGTNRIAFCGQQAPASGAKINNNGSSKFLNLTVADGSIGVEKPSSHGLEVIAASGSIHIGKVAANVDLRSGNPGTGQTYFGSTPLSSIPHKGVAISGAAAVHGAAQSKGLLIDLGGISSRILDVNTSTAVRTNITRMDDRSAVASQTITMNVASGIATSIIGVLSYETGNPSNLCAGKITVQVYNATNNKIGVYELLYRRSGAAIAEVSEISHLYDANIVADTPAFSFLTSGSGSLQVFPKGLTAGGGFVNGDFTFVFSAIGNLTFATK